ncbi:MAG: hypothetical protein JXA67_11060, partial [Micromonosporaceae bacterium]|nr:hypothetical protein [Micromonosporaceae bacterium]
MAGDRARDGAHDQGSLFPDPRGEQGNFPLAGRTEATPAEETGSPLDIPQRFADATSYQVRDELEDLVRRDLLGPWDGETEQFRPGAMGPRERYLVGMLGPRPRPKSEGAGADPAQDVELSTAQGDAGAELPEVLTPQSLGKLWASSMGLSFAVPADTGRLAVTATWGAYRKQETEDDNGKVRSVWAREPVSRVLEVPLDATSARIQLLGRDHGGPGQGGDPDVPGVLLAVEVRPRGDRRVVQLVLINTQLEPASNADSAWLFQPQLAVTALDGAQPVFLPIDDPLDALGECDELGEAGAAGATGASGGNLEEAHLRLLYRAQRRYAAGRNVAVHASADPDQRCAHRLETSWLPVSNVPATVAPSGPESPLAGALLSMDQLAAVDLGELRAGLLPLADG